MAGAAAKRFKTGLADAGSLLLIWLLVPATILVIGAPIALVIRLVLHIAGVQ